MVATQSEAKRFFVDKVIQRARAESVPLSDAERRMLLWSESDPEFKVDPQLVEQLATEISDAEYEMNVAGLLNRAFLADVTVDPQARAVWKQARLVLKRGDHYILVMIDQSVCGKLECWWEFWV